MKKTLLVLTVLVICVTPVWSQGPPRGGGMMACPAMAAMPPQIGMIDRAAEDLALTEDQATKLKAAMTKGEETVKSLSKKSADSSKAFHDALLAETYDADKAKTFAATAEKAEAAVIGARIDEWTAIRAILTADQAKQLQEMMSRQRPGPGQGAGQGPGQGQRQGQRPEGPPPGSDGFPPPDGSVPPPPAPGE